jgi:hypothetical protein
MKSVRSGLIICLAIFLFGAGAAYAGILQLGGSYPSFYYSFDVNNVHGSGYLGSGSIDPSYLDGQSLPWVFCTQIEVDVYVPGTYSDTIVDHTGSSVANADKVAYLLQNYAHSNMTQDQMRALQAAIWHEIYGSTEFSILSGNSTDFVNDYNTYIANVGTGNVSEFDWLTPQNGNSKYQTLVTYVPEPGLALLLGFGIMSVSGLAIRWRR